MSQRCHKLQECSKFHNDTHSFHGYARFNPFWKIDMGFSSFSCSTTALKGQIFAEVIVYCCSTV
jgi:hypothetical protein